MTKSSEKDLAEFGKQLRSLNFSIFLGVIAVFFGVLVSGRPDAQRALVQLEKLSEMMGPKHSEVHSFFYNLVYGQPSIEYFIARYDEDFFVPESYEFSPTEDQISIWELDIKWAVYRELYNFGDENETMILFEGNEHSNAIEVFLNNIIIKNCFLSVELLKCESNQNIPPDGHSKISGENEDFNSSPYAVKEFWKKIRSVELAKLKQSKLVGQLSFFQRNGDKKIIPFEAYPTDELNEITPTKFFQRNLDSKLNSTNDMITDDMVSTIREVGINSNDPFQFAFIPSTLNNPDGNHENTLWTCLDSLIIEEGIEYKTPICLSISFPSSIIKEVNLLHEVIDFYDVDLPNRSFDWVFPDLNKVAGPYLELDWSKVKGILESEQKRTSDKVEIAGIKLPLNEVINIGLPMLLIAQIYFCLHYNRFVSLCKVNSKPTLAWAPTYEQLSGYIFLMATLNLSPLILSIYVYFHYAEFTNITIIALLIWVFIQVLIAVYMQKKWKQYSNI